MGENSTITYENLYNLVRNEKKNSELQELNPEAYKQLTSYLKTKIEIYKQAKEKQLSKEDLDRNKTQIISSRKLIKELYERRERKILHLAINKSRTKSDKINITILLKDEKRIFDDVLKILDRHRTDILLNLVNARLPSGKEPEIEVQEAEETSSNKTTEKKEKQEMSETETKEKTKETIDKTEEKETEKLIVYEYNEFKTIRFIKPSSKFYGKNLEIYGPFKVGDIANLPEIIINILIKKEVAEILH